MKKNIIILSSFSFSIIFVLLCFYNLKFEVKLHKIKEEIMIQHYTENNKRITKTTKTTTYRKKPCIIYTGGKYE